MLSIRRCPKEVKTGNDEVRNPQGVLILRAFTACSRTAQVMMPLRTC